ncbi:MAG: hypothetical protein JKX85_05295 [Phycisphaeraceae bacterium]|nr:hypothetical protein [Phycisphaeraceae bacterium]
MAKRKNSKRLRNKLRRQIRKKMNDIKIESKVSKVEPDSFSSDIFDSVDHGMFDAGHNSLHENLVEYEPVSILGYLSGL